MDHLKRITLGLIVGLMAFVPAYAVPTLSFSVDGAVPVTCADEDACDIVIGTDGVVSISAGLDVVAGNTVFTTPGTGTYSLNVTTGITKPFPGFDLPSTRMDLNSVNVQGLVAGTHTLTIMFSETDFTSLIGGLVGGFGGTISGGGSSVAASAYFDEGNTLFALTTLSATSGPLAAPAFSSSFAGAGPLTQPYSVTQVLEITTDGPGAAFSGDFELNMVPEPASVALLGGALLLTFGALRRKFSQS